MFKRFAITISGKQRRWSVEMLPQAQANIQDMLDDGLIVEEVTPSPQPQERILDYVADFTVSLVNMLAEKETKWGNTWKKRPREGQESRIKARILDYFDQFENAGVPVPWTKIAGLALIGWIRDREQP